MGLFVVHFYTLQWAFWRQNYRNPFRSWGGRSVRKKRNVSQPQPLGRFNNILYQRSQVEVKVFVQPEASIFQILPQRGSVLKLIGTFFANYCSISFLNTGVRELSGRLISESGSKWKLPHPSNLYKIILELDIEVYVGHSLLVNFNDFGTKRYKR